MSGGCTSNLRSLVAASRSAIAWERGHDGFSAEHDNTAVYLADTCVRDGRDVPEDRQSDCIIATHKAEHGIHVGSCVGDRIAREEEDGDGEAVCMTRAIMGVSRGHVWILARTWVDWLVARGAARVATEGDRAAWIARSAPVRTADIPTAAAMRTAARIHRWQSPTNI